MLFTPSPGLAKIAQWFKAPDSSQANLKCVGSNPAQTEKGNMSEKQLEAKNTFCFASLVCLIDLHVIVKPNNNKRLYNVIKIQ